LRQALRLLVLCHYVQERALCIATEALGTEQTRALTRRDVVHAAATSVAISAELFGITSADADVATVVANRYSRNAKDGADGTWTLSSEQLENQRIVAEFGADIDDTIVWHERTLLQAA
jgi:hypothetical protein